MAEEFKFEVGSMYENMKGVYEVISLQRDSMVIRWDNGTEITTSVDLQRRIIERMAFEKELQLQKDSKGPKKSQKSKKAGSGFVGFTQADFQPTSQTATWRNRSNLGGGVGELISSSQVAFLSWAVSRRPEVHWMDAERHQRQHLYFGVVFFAGLNESALSYGLTLKSAASGKDPKLDGWGAFKLWLSENENEKWLKEAAAAQDLVIQDTLRKCFTCDICVDGTNWVMKEEKTTTTLESLSSFFNGLPENARIDLRIEKRVPMEEAISKGIGIIGEIATQLKLMMPLYTMAPVVADDDPDA